MAKYAENNKAYKYKVTFTVDGELIAPTTATYTLRDNEGLIVESLEEIPLVNISTTNTIQIPAEANIVTKTVELRYVTIEFTYLNNSYTLEDYYYIRANNLRIPVTPQEVQTVLGQDIPLDHIDIYEAYGLVQVDAVNVDLDNIITSGSELLPYLSAAVKYRAAMTASLSIETTMMQMEQADNTLYRRFEKVDFPSMREQLSLMYATALARLTGVTDGGVTQLYSTIAVGTDPVTGQ